MDISGFRKLQFVTFQRNKEKWRVIAIDRTKNGKERRWQLMFARESLGLIPSDDNLLIFCDQSFA